MVNNRRNKKLPGRLLVAGSAAAIFSALFGVFQPVHVSAFAGGTGTSGDPYQVTTPAELASLSSYLGSGNSGKYFKLMNDINLDVSPYNTGSGWTPIGTSSSNFYGKFDGDGHTISGLFINYTGSSAGLFGGTNGATVQNVTLSGVNVTASSGYVGGLVGRATTTTNISNVTVGGTVSTPASYAGGIAGYLDNSHISSSSSSVDVSASQSAGSAVGYLTSTDTTSATITGTHASGSAKAALYYAAGFIGSMYRGTISNSYATGSVLGDQSGGTANTYSAGFIGNHCLGIITRSYATGDVYGADDLGGFFGRSHNCGGTISDSYATGNIYPSAGQGGAFGAYIYLGTVVRSFATGSISGGQTNGGFIYWDHTCSSCTDNFWDTETSGQSTGGVFSNGRATGKTTAQMKSVATFTSTATSGLTNPWDFVGNPNNDVANNDYWTIDAGVNGGYPFLSWQDPTSPPSVTTSAISSLTTSGVTLNGNVTSAGTSSLTRRGFVWGASSQSPGSNAPSSSGYDNVLDADSVATGTFSKTLSSLTPGTTYYYRAFAQSSDGVTYGSEVSFATLKAPLLTYPAANSSGHNIYVDVTVYTAVLNSSVQLVFTGSQTVTLTLTDLSAGNHTFTIDPSDPTAASEVASSSTSSIPDDTYDVTFRYTDSGGFMTLSDNSSSFKLDSTAPTLSSLSPTNGASNVAIDANLLMTFNEPVGAETNSIKIYKASDDSLVETIPLGGGPVSGSGTNVMTINPYYNFEYNTEYYVTVDTMAFRDLAGNEYAGFLGSNVWRFTTQANSDKDADGIQNTVEDSAPNNGDANYDGTPDSDQANVTSFVSSITQKRTVLEVDPACTIQSVAMESEPSGSADSSYDYPAGLMNFTANCATPGMTVQINQYLFDQSGSFKLRKYHPNNKTYFEVSGANLTLLNLNGDKVMKVSYQVVDGGELDVDGSSNGTIVDPVGLAAAVTTIDLSTTGARTVSLWLLVGLFVTSAIAFIILFTKTRPTKGRTNFEQ